MRPSTIDLLRIRDGEPVDAAIRAAVDADPELRSELARLAATRQALRELPQLAPPFGAWPKIAERLGQPAETSRSTATYWGLGAAIAAGVAVMAIWLVDRPTSPPIDDDSAPSTIVADEFPQRGPLLGTPAYASLVAESARLERALDGLGSQPRVVRAGTAATIAGLENRLAYVDERLELARPLGLTTEEIQALYRQRVDLLQALVQVRYAAVQRYTF